jgi:Phosphotransferase enzyme family
VGEVSLPGGNAGGAVLVDGTVRRATGPWTPAVHDLLRHLERRGFGGAPRVLGIDEQNREVLTFLPGATVGTARPWPAWVHTDAALAQVGAWLRGYHDAVRDFVPWPEAVWRIGSHRWQPGDVIGHNDAAPYNAVWEPASGGTDVAGGRLVGFIDWDFACPCPRIWDLAFTVFSWVPLHALDVVTAEGFSDLAARPRRLLLLLDAYGYTGPVHRVLEAVQARIAAHVRDIRILAVDDPLFADLVDGGSVDGLERAMTELGQNEALWRLDHRTD